MLEHEGYRAFGAHVAAELGKRMADFSHGADSVISHAIDNDGGAVDAVAFVTYFFIVDAVQATAAALDCPGYVILWHIGIGCLVDCQPQTRVCIDIAAAHTGCHSDFLDQSGPDFAAFGIGGGLLMLNIGPFAVSSHDGSFLLELAIIKAQFYHIALS